MRLASLVGVNVKNDTANNLLHEDKIKKRKMPTYHSKSYQLAMWWQVCLLPTQKIQPNLLEQIEEAETSEQLLAIWEEMKAHSFLNYNVDINKHDEVIDDFKQLSIETQKQHLCEILNKKQLYVNLSKIYNEDFQVSEVDKRLTHDFFAIKKEKEVVQTKADL